MASAANAGEENSECAICFDKVSNIFQLPCDCKVLYCMRCWDRALAQSFNAVGQARCPTCRQPVHVDFDAEANRLVFSRETEIPALPVSDDDGEDSDDDRGATQSAIDRLVEQARPAQVRILKQYGLDHPILRDMPKDVGGQLRTLTIADLKSFVRGLNGETSGCVEKADLIRAASEAAGNARTVMSYWAATRETPLPRCVCGSSLRRVSGKERALSFVQKQFPGATPEQHESLISRFTSMGVICDLCDESLGWRTAVWTCDNGDSTILHATAYDVCDVCFTKNVCDECEDVPVRDAAAGSDSPMEPE